MEEKELILKMKKNIKELKEMIKISINKNNEKFNKIEIIWFTIKFNT